MGWTHIVGEAYNAESKSFEVIGAGVFDTYLIRGQKDKAGETAMTNEVYLSEWFMRNYEAKYFRLFDLTFYNSLKNTFPKRFYHFSKVDGMRRLETPTVNLTADCVKNSFFRTDSLNLESRNSSIQPTMNFRMPDS